eukprot:snap_masked-scaffold_87-processed-gene-0.23-mRNA-1 protein AED:1.00 eAED:1.00 QI:0/0/0/0/1/1/2/0/188
MYYVNMGKGLCKKVEKNLNLRFKFFDGELDDGGISVLVVLLNDIEVNFCSLENPCMDVLTFKRVILRVFPTATKIKLLKIYSRKPFQNIFMLLNALNLMKKIEFFAFYNFQVTKFESEMKKYIKKGSSQIRLFSIPTNFSPFTLVKFNQLSLTFPNLTYFSLCTETENYGYLASFMFVFVKSRVLEKA